MTAIPSPYNFVPLDCAFFPKWASKVSHDVPFSNGISGSLTLEVTTKNPIYIRNGGAFSETDRKNRNSSYNDFFQFAKGKYCIPGSSFKGMIRNILEIASFGKMNKINDYRYSIRDLYDKKYTQEMTEDLGDRTFRAKVRSGWIHLQDGKWELTPCEYARVEQTDLESYHSGRIDLGRRQSAEDKYRQWSLNLTLDFSMDTTPQSYRHSCGHLEYRKVNSIGNGKKGTLVFTGQPMPRSKRNAKHMEFVFFDESPDSIALDKEVVENFEFVHSDDQKEPNKEWRYWKRQLANNKRMPVFYIEDGDNVHSIGLAMMYRFPYHNSIKDAICNVENLHFSEDPDLSELMFGFTSQEQECLKGRIQFSHLPSQGNVEPLDLVKTVLAGPKPTYYPNYINQFERNNANKVPKDYITYMDDDVEIRGWKRYIVRKDSTKIEYNSLPKRGDGSVNEDVATTFRPLPVNTKFKGKVVFHNLLPQELGALVWCLTWGGNDNLRHNIGMGKPFGCGSIKVEITEKNYQDVKGNVIELEDAMNTFKEMMNDFFEHELGDDERWEESDQLYTLLRMADPNAKPLHPLRYPKLENRNNEFIIAKNRDNRLVLTHLEDHKH